MSSITGNKLKVSIFGQSHSEAVGVVIDGLPAGEKIDLALVQRFLDRRAPGQSEFSTARREEDCAEVLSGIVDSTTCGAPLCAVIKNRDVRSRDYDKLRAIPRPAHADFAAFMKYGAAHDIRGGGHFSGRLTAPLCFAGAVCAQVLARKGIRIGAHIASIGAVEDLPFDPVRVLPETLDGLSEKPFAVLSGAAGEAMKDEIKRARADKDSVGGIVECCVLGVAPGVGEPVFDGVENRLSQLLFAIPAVKGVEFGAGFSSARLRGSENNDAFYYDARGAVRTKTNRHGGILGGISSGMPIIFRAAFKPTPSIAKEQMSVDLTLKSNAVLAIQGRHDPCVVPRAVPCVEAAAAIGILDLTL